MDQCLLKQFDSDEDCDQWAHQNCDYNGNVVLRTTPGSIADASHCQQMCEVFYDVGCRYWVFEAYQIHPEDHSTRCVLYDSASFICKGLLGPQNSKITPYHQKCK